MQLKIKGKRHWLWRAVDNQGVVLDILVQQRRDQLAAVTFLRRVLAAALRRALPTTEHRRHKGLNDRAENSHQPTRQRERAMRRFKSPEQAQRFLGPFRAVGAHFRVGRYGNPAAARRQLPRTHRLTPLPDAYYLLNLTVPATVSLFKAMMIEPMGMAVARRLPFTPSLEECF